MRLYLPGPQGPDQLATKWLLVERGYACCCATDVASKDYVKEEAPPDERTFRVRQMYEMQMADAVVVEEDVLDDSAAVLLLVHVCRFAGIRLLRYDELPVQAPGLCRRDEILEERDLVREPAQPVSKRLRVQLRGALQRMDSWARRFDARYGWFFTNGNKTHRVATAVYDQQAPITTTA